MDVASYPVDPYTAELGENGETPGMGVLIISERVYLDNRITQLRELLDDVRRENDRRVDMLEGRLAASAANRKDEIDTFNVGRMIPLERSMRWQGRIVFLVAGVAGSSLILGLFRLWLTFGPQPVPHSARAPIVEQGAAERP